MRVRPALLALLLASFVADAMGAMTVEDLVRDLGTPAGPVRTRARDALLKRKDPACIRPLLGALPRLDLTARTWAQQVLETLPFERTRKVFRGLLRSSDPDLRALAAASLYRKGDASGLPLAIAKLRDETLAPDVQWPIMVRLYSVRHPDVSTAVREGLRRFEGNTLRYALIHVWLVKDGLAVPVVVKLIESSDLEIRLPARTLLYRLGRADVLADLAKDFANPAGSDLSLQDAFRFLATGPRPPEILQGALCDRLDADERAPVRVRILEQLAEWRCHAVLERTEKWIDDRNPAVARATLGLLVELGGRGQKDALTRRLAHRDGRIRVLAAEALYRLDDLSGLPVVLEGARSKTVVVRREAVRALGSYRLRRVIPRLIDALEDTDAMVRRQAWSGVQSVVVALYQYRRLDWIRLGYRLGGPPAVRARAVATLRAWWNARSG